MGQLCKTCSVLLVCLISQVAKAGTLQSIVFNAIPSKTTTDQPFTVTATASSGLAVSFSIVSPGNLATLNGGTITLSGAPGSVTLQASQAGNSTYDPAPNVFRTFVIGTGGFSLIAQGSSASHRLGIKSDGTLWAFGRNSAGQIGNGTTTDVFSPVQITAETTWNATAVGGEFSAAIRGGTLWTWGRNSNGQLGLGDLTDRPSPVQVGSLSSWTHVAAGNTFMIARQSNGTLWAWGNNVNSQLGLGDVVVRKSPTQIGTDTNWSAIAAGSDHVIALKSDGSLWAWGLNSSSQLGDGSTTLRSAPVQIGTLLTWSKVSCGGTSSYAIKANGSLWSWGANSSGQLGVNDTTARTSPTQVGSLTTWADLGGGNIHAIALQTNGSLWSWGGTGNIGSTAQGTTSGSTFPLRIGTDNDWSGVAAGTSYCLAVKSSGSLWSAGSHLNGRLGYPMNNLRPIATGGIQAITQGSSTTHFIRNDGTLWGVGYNASGILGDGTTTTRTLPVQIGTATNWKGISAGNSHSLALRTDGTLWTSGPGLSLVQVGTSLWKSFSAGDSYSLAVRTDGTLWAWGSNSSGQLGDGTTTLRSSPTQIGTDNDWVLAACGSSSSFAIKTNGTLWSWGGNNSGQLGDGTTTQHNSPAQVGTASNWAKVTSGLVHTHAIQSDGTLWAWGANSFGKLGDGTNTQRTSPVQIGSNTNWTMVQSLSQHTIALSSDGKAWTCGSNSSSQLGTGDSADQTTFVQLGSHNMWSFVGNGRGLFTIAVTSDGTLWGTGNNSDYQLSSLQRVWSLLEPAAPAISTQSVTFPPITIPSYNSPVTLTAASTSGLPVAYYASGPATLSGNQLTVTGPGEIKILAYQGGDRPAWHDTSAVQASVAAVPHVTLNPVSSITMTGATLNATVSAAGQATTCLFEYDTDISDSSYAFNLSSTTNPPADYTSVPASAPLAGLTGGGTYYFRLTATNATGASSVTGSFATLPTVFQTWAASNGLTGGNAAHTADADGDGLSNLLEWACNLNPNTPSTLATPLSLAGSTVEFVYSRNVSALNAGTAFQVQWSTTLAPLSWQTAGVSELLISNDGTVQQIKATIPTANSSPLFARLKITGP
jgi:alpha-tubulin suppressor-like RCC1 family protein